jgi:hypothetical protein
MKILELLHQEFLSYPYNISSNVKLYWSLNIL